MNCIDLFCGAGGLSTGLRNAGWNVVLAIDYDSDSLETYKANHPNTAAVLKWDLRTPPSAFDDWIGQIDLVAGGPPCQPFSVAGHQRAAADSRDCIPYFTQAIAKLSPSAFIMENVPGLKTPKHQTYLNNIIKDFLQLGYFVTVKVLNSAHFGVPQFRRRIFFVGMKHRPFEFPKPTHGPEAEMPYVPSRVALQAARPDRPNQAIVTYAKNPVMRPSPYDGLLVNGKGRPIDFDEPSQTIPATAGGNRTHIIDESGVFVEYHRHLRNGGTPREGLVPGVRRLTVSESAALQGFPSDYVFHGSPSSLYRQVGNAIPPGLAEAVGRQVKLFLQNRAVEVPKTHCTHPTLYQDALPIA